MLITFIRPKITASPNETSISTRMALALSKRATARAFMRSKPHPRFDEARIGAQRRAGFARHRAAALDEDDALDEGQHHVDVLLHQDQSDAALARDAAQNDDDFIDD